MLDGAHGAASRSRPLVPMHYFIAGSAGFLEAGSMESEALTGHLTISQYRNRPWLITIRRVSHIKMAFCSFFDVQALSVSWSNLKLPWVDLDWLIDISCQITELDLSANCLATLPSVIPWGLINLRRLNLSDNQLTELPGVQSSDEIICTRCVCRILKSQDGKCKGQFQINQLCTCDRWKPEETQ